MVCNSFNFNYFLLDRQDSFWWYKPGERL